ncbi:sugar ABC transporter permease [Nocardioides sp. GCM10027113]|uniref:sugar ABC transporter permease n=1 Tax=unclassified Nocardioides TaxID=2615069 RepID=UPI003617FD0C
MSDTTTVESDAPLPADLADERLMQQKGLWGAVQAFGHRIRGGELGTLPVIVGLVVIAVVFYVQDPAFLSSRSLVNITLFAAPIGIIALGVVLVLLLGEIDLSVGSVSGLAAAVMAVVVVYNDQSLVLGMLAGLGTGLGIGLVYGLLYTRVGVPSFVITLAGLLGFLGLQLVVLGDRGTVNLPRSSGLVEFTRQSFLSDAVAYALVVVAVAAYVASQLWKIRRRRAAGLSAPSLVAVGIKAGLMLVGLGYLTYYLNIDRGIGYLPLLFIALVVVMDQVLRRTRWGRHVYAVGGNEEAARRSGIRVDRVYISVFALTGMFAALGGLMAAGQLTSVSQASGGTDTNLTAIAAAVIGGTSLFGGRGTAWAALLGIAVLQSIQTGLNVIGVDSSVRFMVTGAVLLLAVAIDSVSRRARSSSGRG